MLNIYIHVILPPPEQQQTKYKWSPIEDVKGGQTLLRWVRIYL